MLLPNFKFRNTKNKLNALDPDSKGATSDWKLKVISSLRFDYLDCK